MIEILTLLLLLMCCASQWGSAGKVRLASVMAAVVEVVLLQCLFVLVVFNCACSSAYPPPIMQPLTIYPSHMLPAPLNNS